MFIVDGQVHIWAAHTPERPWPRWAIGTPEKPRNLAHRPVPFSKDDLLREMAEAQVDRAVIVPPSFEGDRNDVALAAARLHPDRFAVMGRMEARLDEDTPEARAQVSAWCKQPGMLGLRLTFRGKPFRPMLAEGRTDWIWVEAEKASVPVSVMVDREQVQFIDRVAERHPGLKLIMDHLCLISGEKDEEAFSGLDQVLKLARFPNVAVKASALPCYTDDVYPYRRLHPYLRRVYDAFGPQRVFWGTDFTRLPCSYRQAVTMFTEELPWLTARDKEWIMGRGLCDWIGWAMPQV